MVSVAPPRQRRKEARPHELLEAALDLFVEKGFTATRSEEVAVRAGVSKGTLYLYYPSKEELLKAVIRHYLAAPIQAGADLVAHHEGPTADLLHRVLGDWWIDVYDSPASGVFKLIVTEVRNFPEIAGVYRSEVIEPGQRTIGAIVQRGIDRGEFRPVDVAQAVRSLVFPFVHLCLYKHSLGACAAADDALDAHAFVRGHIGLLLLGLQKPPAKGASA